MDQSPVPSDAGISDADRQATVLQVQHAMVQDQIRFEELDDRFAAIYKAQTRGELEAVVQDLPVPPAPVGPPPAHPISASNLALFGDIKIGGWVSADQDLSCATLFGDVVIDLSTAVLTRDIRVTSRSLFGDVTVIVPDGARASLQSLQLFGDRKEDLAPPLPGAPTVTVVAQQAFGDCKLFSLSRVPEGKFRRLWRALRK